MSFDDLRKQFSSTRVSARPPQREEMKYYFAHFCLVHLPKARARNLHVQRIYELPPEATPAEAMAYVKQEIRKEFEGAEHYILESFNNVW